jgi:predicted dehydrogenase
MISPDRFDQAGPVLRAAVIGCGRIGSGFADDPRVRGVYSHAGAYAASPRVELVGVCDADPASAAACANRWGLTRSFTDVAQLMRETRPEIVSVCTPDATHASVLRTVLESNVVRAVLAEKPLAITLPDAEDIVRCAEGRGIALAVNYVRRYAPGHQLVSQSIARGELGEIRGVVGHYTGGILHNGTHWFDALRWLIGEVNCVRGFGPVTAGDPTIDVHLELNNGVTATLLGLRDVTFSAFAMEVFGTNGSIRFADSGHRIEWFDVADSPYASGYRAMRCIRTCEGGIGESLPNAVENLIDSVYSRSLPRCAGTDGLAAMRIAMLARESARTGQPCPLLGQTS